MTQHSWKVYVALVIACTAAALSIVAIRPSRGEVAGGACVDREARDQIAALRLALAERDARVARLERAASPAAAKAVEAAPSEPPVQAAPRARPRFARFETANPAVSVAQNADGSYDIRTSDPALAGSIVEVTAIAESGESSKLFVRVPAP